ncbi:hypothetical protein MKW94_011704 [Papaver nudicaule]|uniref:BHLH domain-containing protein n=1 Tax=Papaver nudicaule TaxID=74823 RepID=A0AA41SP86_PAPNU|nr:hypothetical protein [Papaver nudicaule]
MAKNIMSQEMIMKKSGNSKKSGGGSGSRAVKLSTDPQSVAARERRHRISDRFKILQSLVPGGTKMDTVSMLEEAIHYVQYLKTQIWLHQTMMVTNNNFNIQLDDSSTSNVLIEDPTPPSELSYSHGHYGQDQQHELLYCPQLEPYHNQHPSSTGVVVQQQSVAHQEMMMMMQPYSFQDDETMLVHDNQQYQCFNY